MGYPISCYEYKEKVWSKYGAIVEKQRLPKKDDAVCQEGYYFCWHTEFCLSRNVSPSLGIVSGTPVKAPIYQIEIII